LVWVPLLVVGLLVVKLGRRLLGKALCHPLVLPLVLLIQE
jgi:hypothetical protein